MVVKGGRVGVLELRCIVGSGSPSGDKGAAVSAVAKRLCRGRCPTCIAEDQIVSRDEARNVTEYTAGAGGTEVGLVVDDRVELHTASSNGPYRDASEPAADIIPIMMYDVVVQRKHSVGRHLN